MDNTATFEAYMMFRMSEPEHVAKNYPTQEPEEGDYEEYDYPAWVYQSANVDYEMFLYDQYRRTKRVVRND